MNEYTPIPKVYEECLERIDARIADWYTLGLPAGEYLGRLHDRYEACGCGQCYKDFWREVGRLCDEMEFRDWWKYEIEEEIDKFLEDDEPPIPLV